MNECDRLQEALSAYADGEATSGEARAVAAHLDECASCRATVAQWETIAAAVPATVPGGAQVVTERWLRARVTRRRRVLGTLAAALAIGLASSVTIVRQSDVVADSRSSQAAAGRRLLATVPSTPTARASATASSPPRSQPASGTSLGTSLPRRLFECANAGPRRATDAGVTAGTIRLATPVTVSGLSSRKLHDVRFGIEAMRIAINAAGGICGRRLLVEYYDDGGNTESGVEFFSERADDVFAVPVLPDPDVLESIITSGAADRARVPIVGTLGMTTAEFGNAWVWPVAASQQTFASVVAQHTYDRGARTFGVVFDKHDQQIAARAFNGEVKKLRGQSIDGYGDQNDCSRRYCGIQAGLSSYPNEVREFYGGPADATLLAMGPQTALTWMSDPNTRGARYRPYDAPSLLFSHDFADKCQDKCDGMRVWTSYEAPIAASSDAARRYAQAVRTLRPDADVFDPSIEGAYVGMLVLADAMARVGVDLTRDRLREVLNTQRFDTGLTAPIDYHALRSSLGHDGVAALRSYAIQFKGTFGGWSARSGWVRAPRP